jgi:hypothetical protein
MKKITILAALASAAFAAPLAAQNTNGIPTTRTDTVVQGASTDIGASVAANTAMQLVGITLTRRGFAIQNQTAGDCYLSGLATPTADFHSLKIPTGSYYESKDSHVGTGALSIICGSAGGVYGRQW